MKNDAEELSYLRIEVTTARMRCKQLTEQAREAAAFLDRMANKLDIVADGLASRDCREMAKRLRGET